MANPSMHSITLTITLALVASWATAATPYRTFSKTLQSADLSDTQRMMIEQGYVDAELKKLILNDRVIGGLKATDEEFPYAAALVAVGEAGQLHQFCGGTLINERTVLTAAHCQILPDAAIRVVVGRTDLTKPKGEVLEVKSFIPHPEYQDAQDGNDIAVIQLVKPSAIRTFAELDRTDPDHLTKPKAWAIGWGATVEGGSGSDVLMKVFVPFVQRSICQKSYPGLPKGTLCAGSNGKDTCQGDSGGPLLRIGSGTQLSLSGITSYGYGCGRTDYYGVYTAVAHHLDFILEHTPAPTTSP